MLLPGDQSPEDPAFDHGHPSLRRDEVALPILVQGPTLLVPQAADDGQTLLFVDIVELRVEHRPRREPHEPRVLDAVLWRIREARQNRPVAGPAFDQRDRRLHGLAVLQHREPDQIVQVRVSSQVHQRQGVHQAEQVEDLGHELLMGHRAILRRAFGGLHRTAVSDALEQGHRHIARRVEGHRHAGAVQPLARHLRQRRAALPIALVRNLRADHEEKPERRSGHGPRCGLGAAHDVPFEGEGLGHDTVKHVVVHEREAGARHCQLQSARTHRARPPQVATHPGRVVLNHRRLIPLTGAATASGATCN
mmetsp:Transcript_80200/g.225107  ORF Transcript_80200/g.225107 Transcript_80200/m.225107 type:complete len:307 (-) Transcript_80200:2-922(-)